MLRRLFGSKRYPWGFAVFFLMVLTTPAAVAQDANPRITVFGGGSLLGGSRTFFLGPRAFNTTSEDGGKFGVRGTVDLREHWAVEGSYSFAGNNLQVTQLVPPAVRMFGVHVHQVNGNALYFFNDNNYRLRPFLTGGLGLTRFSPAGDAKLAAAGLFLDQPAIIFAQNHFDVNFGAGVEAKVWGQFGVRFDVRDYVSGIPRYGLPENPVSAGGPSFPVHGVVNNVELSAGFVFYFQ